MSGIKGVIKYISQLLILSSFSIIFLPIICLKCYEEKSEISIFKFMQWSIGKSTKSFLDADMEFVIGRQMKIYIVCALIWVMVTVIFTIIILLVQSQLSYYIAIVAQLFTILSGGLIYLMLRMETKGPILEKISNTSEDYLDHGAGSGGDAVADGDGGDEQVYIRRLSWNKSTVSGKIITYLGRNTVACFDFKFCRSIAQGEKKIRQTSGNVYCTRGNGG